MTAWSAKVSRSAICLSVKGRTSCGGYGSHRWRSLPAATAYAKCGSDTTRNLDSRYLGIFVSVRARPSHGYVSSPGPVPLGLLVIAGLIAPKPPPLPARVRSEPPLVTGSSSTNANGGVIGAANLAAFSTTASSTGWISVGELAMTPKISLVAVCCSNDSLSSWNSRTFSMAITAWSAKVSRSLICPSRRRGGPAVRQIVIGADCSSFSQ